VRARACVCVCAGRHGGDTCSQTETHRRRVTQQVLVVLLCVCLSGDCTSPWTCCLRHVCSISLPTSSTPTRPLPPHTAPIINPSLPATSNNSSATLSASEMFSVSDPFAYWFWFWQRENKQTINYFIVRLKFYQRADQRCLPHIGITKTEKNITKT